MFCRGWKRRGHDTAAGCVTDVLLNSCMSRHQVAGYTSRLATIAVVVAHVSLADGDVVAVRHHGDAREDSGSNLCTVVRA